MGITENGSAMSRECACRYCTRGNTAYDGGAVQSQVVPVPCFVPVASCYRRQAGPASSAPLAPISSFLPAGYGEAIGARLYPGLLFSSVIYRKPPVGSGAVRQRARVPPRGRAGGKSSNYDTIKSRLASGSVLALADFREHLPCRAAREPDRFRHLRHVRAQKRVCRLFRAHGRRDGRLARGEKLLDLCLARAQRGIGGFYRFGEGDIGLGIFVAAID